MVTSSVFARVTIALVAGPDRESGEGSVPLPGRRDHAGAGGRAGARFGAQVRRLAWVGFLVLHVSGGVFALVTLKEAWRVRLNLRILVATVAPGLVSISVALLVLVALLAGAAVGRTIRRLWRRQPEPEVVLRLRVLMYIALACVFVNAFFVSTPESFSGPFRVRLPIVSAISATFAYGAYTLWSLLRQRLRRAFPVRLRRGLDIVCMNAALILILAETGFRVAATFWPSPLLVTDSTPSQVRRGAGRALPGTMHFNFPINQGGHYDTEFLPASKVPGPLVVSIGDSYSYGTVPHAFHFTTVAEQENRDVEIYNMGHPAIGPSDYRYLLEHEALTLDPDLVIVQLFMGNDVGDGASLAGPPRWHDADSYLLAVVWYRLQILRHAELRDSAEIIRQTNLTREELATRYPWLVDPLLEKPSFGQDVFLEIETERAWLICLPHEGVLQLFLESLAEIERVASEVPMAFVLIPDEFQVEDDVWGEIVRRTDRPIDRDLAQRTVIEWLNARGRAVLDLLPLLRAVEPMEDGRRHLYHLRDTHFNARGNEVAGRALAGFVDSLLAADPGPLGREGPQIATESPPVPSLPLLLNIGDSTARRWMQDGWQEDEAADGESYAWSDGVRSVLTVPFPSGGDIRMSFEVLPFVFPGSPRQRVSVVLDGTVVEEVPLDEGRQRYSVILQEEVLRDSPNTLEFRYAYARAPQDVLANSRDVRLLAVAWYSIDFSQRNP